MTTADRPDLPTSSARFNEERATYAVKGEGTPDLDAGIAAIREVVRTLKPVPGVYRMHDARGDVLYVGKARVLKNRVTIVRLRVWLTIRRSRVESRSTWR